MLVTFIINLKTWGKYSEKSAFICIFAPKFKKNSILLQFLLARHSSLLCKAAEPSASKLDSALASNVICE